MRGASRLLRTLVMGSVFSVAAIPALGAECKTLGLVTALDLKMLPSGRPAVEVKIAGAPKLMLIDTGGAISSVTQETVQELKLVETRAGQRIRGVNGSESDMLARLPTLDIGRIPQKNVQFFVLPANNAGGSREFDGLLAGEFLKQFDADFDFPARKLNLFAQDHCSGKVVYWKADKVAVVPFQLGARGGVIGPGNGISFGPDQGNTHIRMRVELDGKRISAILDTGATSTTLNLTEAQRAFNVNVNAPDVQKAGQLTGGFSANVYRKKFKTLTFDGVTINAPEIVLLPDLETGGVRAAPSAGSLVRDDEPAMMLIGMSVLKYLHVFISYQERKLYISASVPPPAPPTALQSAQAGNGQTQGGGFCPTPTTQPENSVPSPALADGMAAFRNRNFPVAYANLWPLADKGNVEAERNVGIVLRLSCGKGDKSSAVAWLKKAADGGDAQGAAVLGDMYEYGDGVAKNDAEAFRLLSIGAAAGILPAQTDLGELYFTGQGVALDTYQGMVWSVRAAEKGAPVALIHIGREYATGRSLPKDAEKAALYVNAGFQRLAPGRRGEFQEALDRVSRLVPKDKLTKIQQDAKAWMPAEGNLAGVLADAGKQRRH